MGNHTRKTKPPLEQKSNMGLQSFNFLATTIIANQQAQQQSTVQKKPQLTPPTKTEKK